MDSSTENKLRDILSDYAVFIKNYCDLSLVSTEYIMTHLQYQIENDLEINSREIFKMDREFIKLLKDIPMGIRNIETDETVDLHDLTQLVYLFNSELLNRCNIQFINETGSVKVQMKKTDLFGVFEEIIKNAVEHGFDDGEYSLSEKTIRITTQSNIKNIQLIISNTGKPIPTDIKEYMFNSYNSSVALNRGNGLWNVKNTLNNYAATISSSTGLETQFIITFKNN